MSDPESVPYIGYGPHSDPDMIEAVTGEPPIWVSRSAILQNVELSVQGLDEIPDDPITEEGISVRGILRNNYGDAFEAYGLRPSQGNVVKAKYFGLSQKSFDRMLAWDFVDEDWHEARHVEAIVHPAQRISAKMHKFTRSGTAIFIPARQKVKRIADGIRHQDFLVDKEVMIRVAEQVRAQLDEQS